MTLVAWDQRDALPVEGAVKIHPDICITWAWGYERPHLLVWHWCDRSVWLRRPGQDPALATPAWNPAGVAAHTLVNREPLHLEPSLLWADCCGMHGFIRDGQWSPA